jgi:NTE family protein
MTSNYSPPASLTNTTTPQLTGLVLTGGGARAAYQVGVIQALNHILGQPTISPFQVICGASAGAINATMLASGNHNFSQSSDQLAELWQQLTIEQVYKTHTLDLLKSSLTWVGGLSLGKVLQYPWVQKITKQLYSRRHSESTRPRSLLNNRPLFDLLDNTIDYAAIQQNIQSGALQALCITASRYDNGQSIHFYQGAQTIQAWKKHQRLAIPEPIKTRHLIASSAIPFVFPAVSLKLPEEGKAFFGDGAVRQTAPLSPAIHLGAKKVLVVGAGQMQNFSGNYPASSYPSLAQIAGHTLSSIFLDNLVSDIQRIHRTNELLACLDTEGKAKIKADTGMENIDLLVIAPSQRLDSMAAQHVQNLPTSMRALLRALGANPRRGSALISYLLFEPGYTGQLIELGYTDTLAQAKAVESFFAK